MELTNTEQLLRNTIDSSMDMIQVFKAVRNDAGEILDFIWILNNKASEAIYGDVIGKSLLTLNPGVVQEGIFDAFKEVVETGIPQQYEKHYTHEQFDGWFYQSVAKLEDGVATTTRDITERKKAEAQILQLKDTIAQKATDKYLTLFNSIDEAVAWMEMITDENGKPVDYRLLEVNPAYSNMSGGLTGEDSVGKTAKELIPNVEQSWINTVAKVAFEGESIRIEQHVKDLNSWFLVYLSPVGDKKNGQFVAVYSDITVRKRQEEKQAYLLKLSDATRSLSDPDEILNEALKTVAEYLNLDRIGYNEIDPDITEYWYRACYAREGFEPVLGRFPMGPFKETVRNLQKGITFIANDAYANSFSEAEKEVHRSFNVGAYVTVPLVKNSRWVCNLVAQYSTPRTWLKHEIDLLEETAERIWAAVERAKAEEALRDSEASLSALFAAMPIGVALVGLDGKTIFSNSEMQRFLPTGMIPSVDKERGWRWRGYYPDGRPVEVDKYPGQRALRNETGGPIEFLYTQDDGTEVWTRVNNLPVSDSNGNVTRFICVVTDINDLKRNTEALRESN